MFWETYSISFQKFDKKIDTTHIFVREAKYEATGSSWLA